MTLEPAPLDVENELGQPVGWALEFTPPPVPPTTTMAGRYCSLELLDHRRHGAELHDAYSQAADGGDWTYLSAGPFATLEPFIEWLASVENSDQQIFFVVVDAATGRSVGLASYLRLKPAVGVIEVGSIHFSRAMQRTPTSTEAMYLMMQRAFELGYRRYEWKCDALNAPSKAAATRLGFTYEGMFRQATMYKGRNRDTAWFSILDREWPTLDAEFRRWLSPDNFDAERQQRTPLACRQPGQEA